MGMHYTERQRAQESVGRALLELGWRLWGYHEDRSDSMTDYYCPASWDGVATLEREDETLIAGVDVSPYVAQTRSGHIPEGVAHVDDGECSRCEGSGTDPEIPFTLAQARIDPRGFHAADKKARKTDAVNLLQDVVSPLLFKGDGNPKCIKCGGTGRKHRTEKTYGEQWPTFKATPKGKTWHVEREGEITLSGTGLNRASNNEEEARKLAQRIHDAATVSRAVATGEGITLKRNEARNGVELYFPSKPPAEVRLRLKAAGFRWARKKECWYKRATPDAVAFAEKMVGIAP